MIIVVIIIKRLMIERTLAVVCSNTVKLIICALWGLFICIFSWAFFLCLIFLNDPKIKHYHTRHVSRLILSDSTHWWIAIVRSLNEKMNNSARSKTFSPNYTGGLLGDQQKSAVCSFMTVEIVVEIKARMRHTHKKTNVPLLKRRKKKTIKVKHQPTF